MLMRKRKKLKLNSPGIPREKGTGKRESWRPIHAGEAFQRSNSYARQMLAQRLYYGAVKAAQRLAVKAATGRFVPRSEKMTTKAQLGQLYSDLPARFAAQAGVGHSAFLEFDRRMRNQPLWDQLSPGVVKDLHESSFGVDAPELGPFVTLAKICIEALNTRLRLLGLERERGLTSVEHYRIFLASQYPLPPTTTAQMVRAIVLFGDLLFPLVDETVSQMHPTLRLQYKVAASVARVHEPRFRAAKEDELIELAAAYGKQLIVTLGSFIPPPTPVTTGVAAAGGTSLPDFVREALKNGDFNDPRVRSIIANLTAPVKDTEFEKRQVAPLDTPPPPQLEEGNTPAMDSLTANLNAGKEGAAPAEEAALVALQNELVRVLTAANDTKDLVNDPRPDQVERMLRANPFKAGKLEGNPAGVTEIDDVLGWEGRGVQSASISHEVLVPPDDPSEYDELRRKAAPLIARLRKLVYPDTSKRPLRRRFCTSGAPDPVRLPLFAISDTIYRRNEMQKEHSTTKHGPSCVLIACDASGSMKSSQLSLLKLLTCAFAESLHDARRVRVLAGVYHTDRVGDAPEGPVVKWLLHPRLTPSLSPRQAARAITSLPTSGSGVNHDAISLTYMLEEARSVVPGGTCYVINLTDAKFNARERGGDGTAEMVRLLSSAKELDDLTIHYTVVAIGKPESYRLTGADRVVTVQEGMVEDQVALAERIASFVAKELANQRKISGKGGG